MSNISITDIRNWCIDNFGPANYNNWVGVWDTQITSAKLTAEFANANYCKFNYHEYILPSNGYRHLYRFSFMNKEDAILFRLTWG